MPITVLVVDDSALMRKALKQILVVAGATVHTARNGLDALDQIPRVQPDVVTLDINMPEMDGLTCLHQIMQSSPCPVVMVSSLTERNAMATLEALELGAVDYVTKPGGTVSLNIDDVAAELVDKVRAAASARVGRASRVDARVAVWPEPAVAPSRPVRATADHRRATVDLVLVGSSTGGPPLLSALLTALPESFGAPIVVAQHIPASFTTALAARLGQSCHLRVHEVMRSMPIKAGNIYIARGSADVVVTRRNGALVVQSVPSSSEYRWHPSVDRLAASARRHIDPKQLVCVLLTGMGDDGAAEMAAINAAGGRTIAESEETAVVWGMPGELARRGGATAVLPSYSIADQLIDWVR
jgi:two-component system, chemotaxis family, protein-glutamate methylesterase/glutaminase